MREREVQEGREKGGSPLQPSQAHSSNHIRCAPDKY